MWGFAEFDILAVYYEMFEEKQYFKHGIGLKENDMVLDIGANTYATESCMCLLGRVVLGESADTPLDTLNM